MKRTWETVISLRPAPKDEFETLVREHVDSVYRFTRNLTGSTHDAEDLTQETFLEAEKSLRKFRGECSVRTYLHRIAYRRFCRWRKRHALVEVGLPETAIQATNPHFKLDLATALKTLSHEHRAVFILAEIEELDLNEVSQALDLPLGTVKSRLSRAKAALRIALCDRHEPY